MFFSALLISLFFSSMNFLHSIISFLICLMISTSSSFSSFFFSFFSLQSWQLRSSKMATFLAQPLSQLLVLSLSFFNFFRFYYQIFFWISFQFFSFCFFMSMYLKSVGFSGILTYDSLAALLSTGAFFFCFCYSKIFLFFSLRSSSAFLASSYSFRLSQSSFFFFSSFFFCISFLLYQISFILRFISDSDNFSFLSYWSAQGFFSFFVGFLVASFFAGAAMFLALAGLFLFGWSFVTSLLFFGDFKLDLTLSIPASLSLELSMNSDLASDISSSFLNSKSL